MTATKTAETTGPPASELEERHRLSFWDALVVVSARRSGARVLLGEDLQV